MVKTSWKTTVGAIIAGIAAALLTPEMVAIEPAWLHTLAGYLNPIGIMILGLSARDHNVTSEQANAGK